MTMDDARPPVLTAAPTGSLVTGGSAQAGPQTFSVGATDDGGGVAAVAW